MTQNDHAVLAGDLAARLDFPPLSGLSSDVVRAIAVHDVGWAQIDNGAVGKAAAGIKALPSSFLAIAPAQFLIAWTDSISAAQSTGALGETIVSQHFRRLASNRLASQSDSEEDVERLEVFLREESSRQIRLRAGLKQSAEQLEMLTDVLQFCDLVSLYLCCGADDCAEFPQQFGEGRVRVRREEDAFFFTPAVFGCGGGLGVSARSYPGNRSSSLPFLLG